MARECQAAAKPGEGKQPPTATSPAMKPKRDLQHVECSNCHQKGYYSFNCPSSICFCSESRLYHTGEMVVKDCFIPFSHGAGPDWWSHFGRWKLQCQAQYQHPYTAGNGHARAGGVAGNRQETTSSDSHGSHHPVPEEDMEGAYQWTSDYSSGGEYRKLQWYRLGRWSCNVTVRWWPLPGWTSEDLTNQEHQEHWRANTAESVTYEPPSIEWQGPKA